MTTPYSESHRLIPVADVAQMLACSRSAIWLAVREGSFPAPIKIGPRMSRWRLSEIKEMIDQAEKEARGTPATNLKN